MFALAVCGRSFTVSLWREKRRVEGGRGWEKMKYLSPCFSFFSPPLFLPALPEFFSRFTLINFSCFFLKASLKTLIFWKTKNKIEYNFQQRISWLSHRWRTQRNAISNVNCRPQWIIESLNAYCTLWYSGEYACFSISKHHQTPSLEVVWIWALPRKTYLFSARSKCKYTGQDPRLPRWEKKA